MLYITILFLVILSFTSRLGILAHEISVLTVNWQYGEKQNLGLDIPIDQVYYTGWIKQKDNPGTEKKPNSPCFTLPRSKQHKNYDDDIVMRLLVRADQKDGVTVPASERANFMYFILYEESKTLGGWATGGLRKLGLNVGACSGEPFAYAKWPRGSALDARLVREELGVNLAGYRVVYRYENGPDLAVWNELNKYGIDPKEGCDDIKYAYKLGMTPGVAVSDHSELLGTETYIKPIVRDYCEKSNFYDWAS